MRYDKPEVVKVANAVYAIQSTEKQIAVPDSEGPNTSTPAYEADE
jgi:hypothetical protein